MKRPGKLVDICGGGGGGGGGGHHHHHHHQDVVIHYKQRTEVYRLICLIKQVICSV